MLLFPQFVSKEGICCVTATYSQMSDVKVDKLVNITNHLSELSFGKQGWYLCYGFSSGSSEILNRTLKATTRTALTNERVLKTCMNHFMSSSCRTFRCEVAHKWDGERSWPELSAVFFSKLH